MKPNDKQKAVARLVELQGKFWQNTNDINSPTHYCDLEAEIQSLELEGVITPLEAVVLEDHIADVFRIIQNMGDGR